MNYNDVHIYKNKNKNETLTDQNTNPSQNKEITK